MSEDETPPKYDPVQVAFPELLDRVATHADVAMATLKEAIRECSYEKNKSRRRIGKALAFFMLDPEALRKRLAEHEKKHPPQ